jgi:hypothetical protein
MGQACLEIQMPAPFPKHLQNMPFLWFLETTKPLDEIYPAPYLTSEYYIIYHVIVFNKLHKKKIDVIKPANK